jgi:hypothetical protein
MAIIRLTTRCSSPPANKREACTVFDVTGDGQRFRLLLNPRMTTRKPD